MGYGLGDAGFNFYWAIIGSYLVFFYTDIFGIPAATAAIMVTATKIVDAITDPLMGAIADRTSTRFGRFRPYLLFGALPMMVAGILAMTTPDLGLSNKIVWAYCSYGLMMLTYTVLNTPYNALSGVMTSEGRERSLLNSVRFFFAYLSSIVVGAATPGLAKYFGGGDRYSAYGWQMTMTLYASVASVLFVITFISTRERVVPASNKAGSNPLEDFLNLVRCKPWLVLFLVSMVFMTTMTLRGTSAPYYLRYFVQRPDLLGAYIGIQFVGLMLGALLCGVLTRFMEKKRLLIIALVMVGVLSTLLGVIPRPSSSGVVIVGETHEGVARASSLLEEKIQPGASYRWFQHMPVFWIIEKRVQLEATGDELSLVDHVGQKLSVKLVDNQEKVLADSAHLPLNILFIFLLNFAISVALGLKSPITWSMYADVADYNEWRTGHRATGMTFSATTFSQKLGSAGGSAMLLAILAQLGYQAGQLQQDSSLSGIVYIQSIVPGIFACLTAAVLCFYHLDRKVVENIQNELRKRHSST